MLASLNEQLEKLKKSKEAYQRNLAAAKEAVAKFETELIRHEGAIWSCEQLIEKVKEPVQEVT